MLVYLHIENTAPANLKKWAVELRVSDRRLKKAVDELKKRELVFIKTETSRHQLSKKMRRYELNIQMLEEHFKPAKNETPHLDVLNFVVRNAFSCRDEIYRDEESIEPLPLMPRHSLLLAMLLLNADGYGVVDDLSKNKLRKLTGYTQSQLNYQLDLLIKAAVVVTRSTGSAKTNLVGRTKSIYLIRLEHMVFGKKKYEVKQLARENFIFSFSQRSFIGNTLDSREKKVSSISADLTKSQAALIYRRVVSLFFKLRMTSEESVFFQVQCERFLSILFTDYLRHLRSVAPDPTAELKLFDYISERINEYEDTYFNGCREDLKTQWPQPYKSSIFFSRYEEALVTELESINVRESHIDLIDKFLVFLIHEIILTYPKKLLDKLELNLKALNHCNIDQEFIRFRQPSQVVYSESDKAHATKRPAGISHIIEHVWRNQP